MAQMTASAPFIAEASSLHTLQSAIVDQSACQPCSLLDLSCQAIQVAIPRVSNKPMAFAAHLGNGYQADNAR